MQGVAQAGGRVLCRGIGKSKLAGIAQRGAQTEVIEPRRQSIREAFCQA